MTELPVSRLPMIASQLAFSGLLLPAIGYAAGMWQGRRKLGL